MYVGYKRRSKYPSEPSASIAVQTRAASEDDNVEMSSLDHEKNMKVMYPRRPEQNSTFSDHIKYNAGRLLLRADDEYLSEGELTFEDYTALVSIVSEDAPLSSNNKPLQEVQLRGKFIIGDDASNMASLKRRKVYPPPPVPPKPKVKKHTSYHLHKIDSQHIPPHYPNTNSHRVLNGHEKFKFCENSQLDAHPVAQASLHGEQPLTQRAMSTEDHQLVSPQQKRIRMAAQMSDTMSYKRSSDVSSYTINTDVSQMTDTSVHCDELNRVERMQLRKPKHMEEVFLEARYERTMHESCEITSPLYVNNPAKLWQEQRKIRQATANNLDSSFGSSCSSVREYKATEGIAQELPAEYPCMADDIQTTRQYINMAYSEITAPSHFLNRLQQDENEQLEVSERNIPPGASSSHHMMYSVQVNQPKVRDADRAENNDSCNIDPVLDRTPLLDYFNDSSSDGLPLTNSPELFFGKNIGDISSGSSSDAEYNATLEDSKIINKQSRFEHENELDEILENATTETYSPSSTLSRAFTRPRHKDKKHKEQILKIKHLNPVQKKHKTVSKLVTLESLQTQCCTHRIEEDTAGVRSIPISSQLSQESSSDTVISPIDLNTLDDDNVQTLQNELKVAVTSLLEDPPRSTSSPVFDLDVSASSTICSLHADNRYDSMLSHEIELITCQKLDTSYVISEKTKQLNFSDVNEGKTHTEVELEALDTLDGVDLERVLDEDEFCAILSTSNSSIEYDDIDRADLSLSEILETSDILLNNQEVELETIKEEYRSKKEDTFLINGHIDVHISDSSSENLDVLVRRNSEVLDKNEVNQIILDSDNLRNEGIESDILESDESRGGSLLTVLNGYSLEDCSMSDSVIIYKSIDAELLELKNDDSPTQIYHENIESLKMLPPPKLNDTKESPNTKRRLGDLHRFKSVDTAIHELTTISAGAEVMQENRDFVKLVPSPVLNRTFDFELAVASSKIDDLTKFHDEPIHDQVYKYFEIDINKFEPGNSNVEII